VPGYRLVKRLGGGYDEVWQAVAPGGFPVALKLVSLERAAGAVELRALDLLRDVRHPNLLVTFGAWQAHGLLVIAMELADRTLADRFAEASAGGLPGIPRDELLGYLLEAARAIDYLNEPRPGPCGEGRVAIQHRDIKPQNILLVADGVKVADFGLARVLRQTVTGHSLEGLTPAYAAPEFFEGLTTKTSDQYSLALTYHKMRTGRLPFEGVAAQVMLGHLRLPPDLSALPPEERPVVARALAKDPAERWPTCRAFAEALRSCPPAGLAADGATAPASAPPPQEDTASHVHSLRTLKPPEPPAARPPEVDVAPPQAEAPPSPPAPPTPPAAPPPRRPDGLTPLARPRRPRP
jgi:serine/threonine protein kinase